MSESVKFLCMVLVMASLSACGVVHYASNSETHYLSSRNGPRLVVPSGLHSDALSDFYVLPATPTPYVSVSIAPPV